MKRLIASVALGASLLGGAVVPMTLTAQSASASQASSHENASPNLPVKAQEALKRNGQVDRVGVQSCVVFPSGIVVCY